MLAFLFCQRAAVLCYLEVVLRGRALRHSGRNGARLTRQAQSEWLVAVRTASWAGTMLRTQGRITVLLFQLNRRPALKRGRSNLLLSVARPHDGAPFAKGASSAPEW